MYGLRDPEAVVAQLKRLAGRGLFTIVNETVDVEDGGVSGVMVGDVCEFAPGDTPRCVEKPGTASLPRDLAPKLLRTVYGFEPGLAFDAGLRVEFSIHPLRRGFRNTHTIVWEIEEAESVDMQARIAWPNRFSEFLGDKAYGLLIGACLGLPIPLTTVVSSDPERLARFEREAKVLASLNHPNIGKRRQRVDTAAGPIQIKALMKAWVLEPRPS